MTDNGESSSTPPSLIRPPNKMKHKVTAGGRVAGPSFDPELLRQAEEASAAAFEAFDAALDEAIERLMFLCQRLEDEPENRQALLAQLESTATEMAGSGAQSGYDLLSRFGESLLAFLNSAEATEEVVVRVVRAHVDSMRLIYIQERTGDGGDVGQRLAHALNATLVKFAGKSRA